MLIDAHLAPSDAIALAMANELNVLRVIALKLAAVGHEPLAAKPDDLLVVVPLGELVGLVADQQWRSARAQSMRLVRRSDLPLLWSSEAELRFPGQRLVLDVGLAAAAVWHWLSERSLMTDIARVSLLAEIKADHGKLGFAGSEAPILRRR